jgi:chromosome segregation ATPase
MPPAPSQIGALIERIETLDRDEIRRLARAAERHQFDPKLPLASAQREALEGARDEAPELEAQIDQAQSAVRRAMAARLAQFKELRADHTYKRAVQTALGNAAFAIVARDHLSQPLFDRLVAPWRELTGEPR